MSNTLRIPAEHWDRMITCCCSSQLQNDPAIDQQALPVPARRWKNNLYVGFYASAIGIGARRDLSFIEAYRLVPDNDFKGPTTCLYQTDHVGYEVLYANKRFVCAEQVNLVKGMPSSAPIAMAEAQAIAAAEMVMTGFEVWSEYEGHPTFRTGSFDFIVYRGRDGKAYIDSFDTEPPTNAKAPGQYLLI